MTRLCGITWAHSRGYTPLVAAAEAWHDLHPEVAIEWRKRSFWGFGEGPLDEVARDYDLIVFDHPHTGAAAERGLLAPLGEIAVGECAGGSSESYVYRGSAFGLPIDGACQAAAYRPDLLERVPRTWDEVIELARRTGRVRCAFSPMGALGMLHSISGGPPDEAGLTRLRELYSACGSPTAAHSPVRILAEMAATGEVLYAPLLYAYSNYCRAGFAPRKIAFTPAVAPHTTLGGAGLGISTFTRETQAARDFARWLISPECQSGLYLHAQGQPALLSTWQSEEANALTGGFFRDLLPAMERAYVRPNGSGYPEWQSRAGAVVQAFLQGERSAEAAIEEMNRP
jgi:multiple sugar transport system substrate-binding protein